MRQFMFMRDKGFSRPISQRLSRSQIDIDAQLVDGGRERSKADPREGKVRTAMGKSNIEFVSQALRRNLVLDCLLEFSIRLSTYAQ